MSDFGLSVPLFTYDSCGRRSWPCSPARRRKQAAQNRGAAFIHGLAPATVPENSSRISSDAKPASCAGWPAIGSRTAGRAETGIQLRIRQRPRSKEGCTSTRDSPSSTPQLTEASGRGTLPQFASACGAPARATFPEKHTNSSVFSSLPPSPAQSLKILRSTPELAVQPRKSTV
jgi:hypothetical protein